MKDPEKSNPVQVVEYAVTKKISEEPAIAWWVQHVLRCRDKILKKMKSRDWSKTRKFGIEPPKSVKAAMEIDRKTGTDF